MLNDSLIYNFYYTWWKKIDKTIFLLIIFVAGAHLQAAASNSQKGSHSSQIRGCGFQISDCSSS